MRPTSIRLTPDQEAELAALVIALPLRDPYVAAVARGGTLTPGAVLRLAVARGLAALRRDVGPDLAPPVRGVSFDLPEDELPVGCDDLGGPLAPVAAALHPNGAPDPFKAADAPADDHAGPVARLAAAPPVTLPARPAATAGDLARLCAAVPADAPVLVRQGEGWFDFGQGEVRDGRPVDDGDPDDPGCEVGWDLRAAGPRAPRGRWRRVLAFE